MTVLVGLFVAAFLLFLFEIFLPGGVLAIMGMVLLFIAGFISMQMFGIVIGMLVLLGSLSAALVLFFLEVYFLQKGPFAKIFISSDRITSVSNAPVAKADLVGQSGEALTKMRPSGKVCVGERVYEATCQEGSLEPGDRIEVLRVDPFKVLVKKSGGRPAHREDGGAAAR